MDKSPGLRQYWNKLISLTGALLVVWFVVTFVISWYARELSSISFMGWPFPFYMASQGALVIYILIIGFYAFRMNQLDRDYDVQEKNSDE
jgi:putative solute:sodium symporter small subunit